MQAIKKFLLVAALIIIPQTVSAIEFPAPKGYVNDFANVINTETFTQLTNILTQFESKTGNEIAIATVKSLEGEPVENYAVKLFEKWGIGKKKEDNGALILVAPADHKMRIEVGYGLEPYINDALAGRIIRDTMIPHFRDGDFSLGILNGTVELVTVIAKKTDVPFDPIAAGNISASNIYHLQAEPKSSSNFATKLFKILFIVVFIIIFIKNPWAALFILSSFGGGGRSSGSSFRGGFGGGFSGFGGGSSGGGGASGSW